MKHIKLFEEHANLFEDDSEKFLNDMQSKLDKTKDLWDIDIIGSKMENGDFGDLRSLGKSYTKYHFEMVPAWIKKHWGKAMLYKGENLFDILYKDWEPKFKELLKEKGYDAQECFVSYEVGANPENTEDSYYTGKFKMGFDIWETEADKENAKSGLDFMFGI